jgi:hypothetical protein
MLNISPDLIGNDATVPRTDYAQTAYVLTLSELHST